MWFLIPIGEFFGVHQRRAKESKADMACSNCSLSENTKLGPEDLENIGDKILFFGPYVGVCLKLIFLIFLCPPLLFSPLFFLPCLEAIGFLFPPW